MMKRYQTWMVGDPIEVAAIEQLSVSSDLILQARYDPSYRHWIDNDRSGYTVKERECSFEEEQALSGYSSRGKEILICCNDQMVADNFLSLIHAGILLGYPDNLNFTPKISTLEVDDSELGCLRKDPFHKWFTYHQNTAYGCLVARRAWTNPSIRYALHKWRMSIDLDSFTPHSASPLKGQVFPSCYPDDTYHVKAAFAVNAAFSAIEELGLEVRSSSKKPRFLGDSKDAWNEVVLTDLKERLEPIGVAVDEDFHWVLRGSPRAIEQEIKPALGMNASWSNGGDVRDRTLCVSDAIHYASFIRNFISAHKFHELIDELGPYDVFNVQMVARRLILGALNVWQKSFDEIIKEDLREN